jgi:hypothetical protein
VGEGLLTQIITTFGLGEGEVLGSYDEAGLAALLGGGYLDYYGIGGNTHKAN